MGKKTFTGLDVSELASATIDSAYVRIRDMMCEDDPLDVSCHIFTELFAFVCY